MEEKNTAVVNNPELLLDEEDDIDFEFEAEMKALETDIDKEKLKRDTKQFASQFPNWDLHPPRAK